MPFHSSQNVHSNSVELESVLDMTPEIFRAGLCIQVQSKIQDKSHSGLRLQSKRAARTEHILIMLESSCKDTFTSNTPIECFSLLVEPFFYLNVNLSFGG